MFSISYIQQTVFLLSGTAEDPGEIIDGQSAENQEEADDEVDEYDDYDEDDEDDDEDEDDEDEGRQVVESNYKYISNFNGTDH